MFTGIVTDIGVVRSVSGTQDKRFSITTRFDISTLEIGASIACSGPCLTVTGHGHDAEGAWFSVDASAETLRCTSLGGWGAGTRINLERALRVGDELGGHIVTGHVDGVGRLEEVTPEGGSLKMVFRAPPELASFIAAKGSITIDGVSLTVNTVSGARFTVNIIPITQTATTLGDRRPGDGVNLEVDLLARYIARLSHKDAPDMAASGTDLESP